MTARRVLVVVFEMDDTSNVLGWQARVVSALADRVERVVVLTDRLGSFDPPPNVRVVLSDLPNRGVVARLRRLAGLQHSLWRLIDEERIEACFVHMNHRAVVRDSVVMALRRVPVLLWYAHGSVSPSLRLAHHLADRVVTSTPEGFRLRSRTVRVIGQGIDVSSIPPPRQDLDGSTVVTTGRISPRKRLDLVVAAAGRVVADRPDDPIRFEMIGPTLTDADKAYRRELLSSIERSGLDDRVILNGPVPADSIAAVHENAFVHVNVSETGSMDKTVLEALAAGVPVITTNPAFESLLRDQPGMFLRDNSPGRLSTAILAAYDRRAEVDRLALRSLVIGHHDLGTYADRVVSELDDLAAAGTRS